MSLQVLLRAPDSLLRPPDKVNDDLRQFGAFVFLQKMSGACDRHVWLALRARDQFLKDPLAASRHRIAVAEGRQQRFLPTAKNLPRLAIVFRSGIIWSARPVNGELTM